MVNTLSIGCGYCKECVKLRVMKAIGRTPETAIECAYKHILDSYSVGAEVSPSESPAGSSTNSSSPAGSCNSNCRWTSSGTPLTRPSYDDTNFSDDDYGCSPYMYRKRIKFVKRKKV